MGSIAIEHQDHGSRIRMESIAIKDQDHENMMLIVKVFTFN